MSSRRVNVGTAASPMRAGSLSVTPNTNSSQRFVLILACKTGRYAGKVVSTPDPFPMRTREMKLGGGEKARKRVWQNRVGPDQGGCRTSLRSYGKESHDKNACFVHTTLISSVLKRYSRSLYSRIFLSDYFG